MQFDDLPAFVRPDDLAKLYRTSEMTILRWAKDGHLPPYQGPANSPRKGWEREYLRRFLDERAKSDARAFARQNKRPSQALGDATEMIGQDMSVSLLGRRHRRVAQKQ